MKLTYDMRTYPAVTLSSPLTRDELVERIYREGQRLIGYVKVPLEVIFNAFGTEEAEQAIAEAFVGSASVHPGSIRYWPTDRSSINGLVMLVEVHVDIDDLGVDWDHIDDPEDPSGSGDQPTRSFHHHTSRPLDHPDPC